MCVYVYIYIIFMVYVYIYICVCVCIYISFSWYMCIYICVYIYIYHFHALYLTKVLHLATITMFKENKHLCSAPARAKARGHCAVKPLRTNIIAGYSPRSRIDFISAFRLHALISLHSITGPDRCANCKSIFAVRGWIRRIRKSYQICFFYTIVQTSL